MAPLIIAFSMYSKIPMPRVEWNDKNMKYAFCYFPLVGLVIGLITIGEYYLFTYLNMGSIFKTVFYMVTPLLVTGGIHFDGLIDTMDARNSYQDKEKKLEILKDPHIGAFALICSIIYYLITMGFMSEITPTGIFIISIGYVYSRALSGLGVVTLKGAKSSGLVAMFSDMAKKKTVCVVMICYIILGAIAMILISPIIGAGATIAGILSFLYYKKMSYKEFDGITGDLAGYFVQLCELSILIITVICSKI